MQVTQRHIEAENLSRENYLEKVDSVKAVFSREYEKVRVEGGFWLLQISKFKQTGKKNTHTNTHFLYGFRSAFVATA